MSDTQSGLTKKKIHTAILLGTGDFGGSGFNQVDLDGYRCFASIVKAGPGAICSLTMQIYGLPLNLINELTTLGMNPIATRINQVVLTAGDDVNGMQEVFKGTIQEAHADFNGAPETVFNIIANTIGTEQVKPVAARSYSGAADAASILSAIAAQMGLAFVNNGVNVKLNNVYLHGTLLDQAHDVANAGRFNMDIDGNRIVIWPQGKDTGDAVVEVSAQTGMIGYPTFNSMGCDCVTIFNPTINFGQKITLQSVLKSPSRDFIVTAISHEISAELPNGPWFTHLSCAVPGYGPISE